VIDKDKGEFFSSMPISSKQDNFNWEIINVYGPVQSEKKAGFLDELSRKVSEEYLGPLSGFW
jgi:hypothetical protein